MSNNDPINPNHYKTNSGIECIDVAQSYSYPVGNALKYAWRAGLKADLLEDLKKCRWYVHCAVDNAEGFNEMTQLQHISCLKLDKYLSKETNHQYPERVELLRALATLRLHTADIIVDDIITALEK